MKTKSYLEEPNRHFCQHFMQRTTQQTFSAVNLTSQQKTTKLFFSSQVRKQFKLLAVPFKSLHCCLRSGKLVNCHVWKFYKDQFLNFRVSSSPDLSIKSYLLMVSSLILLRSLRVYIRLFFSISVNSGFRNLYLATSWLGKYLATIHLDFKIHQVITATLAAMTSATHKAAFQHALLKSSLDSHSQSTKLI